MTTKPVCQLDNDDYFVGMTVADESPLELGVWLMPARAVDVTAPEVPEGYRAKWNGASFDLEAIPVDPEPEPPTLSERRAAVWEKVKAIRQEKTERGGFFAAGKWFHSDVFSRTQQLGLIIAAQQFVATGGQPTDPIPGVPPWSTLDNTTIVLTPAVVSQFLPAFSTQEGAMFSFAASLRQQIEVSDDPESIDITTGWPAIYGD